jgi:site-specific recombinase XerD
VRKTGWDKGLDYESTYSKILKHMTKAKYPALCYDAILLTQLRNGSRVSEAVRSFREFLTTKSIEVSVRVSKRRDNAQRLMVIPRELLNINIDMCKELLGLTDAKLVNRVKTYVKEAYGFNTHSLRYAFVTHLLRQGVSPAVVSKITGHKNLGYILTYTQEKAAEQILKEGL